MLECLPYFNCSLTYPLLIYLTNVDTLSMMTSFMHGSGKRVLSIRHQKQSYPVQPPQLHQEVLGASDPQKPTFLISIYRNHASSVRLVHFALTSRLVKSSWPHPPLSVLFQSGYGNFSAPCYIHEMTRHRSGKTGGTGG